MEFNQRTLKCYNVIINYIQSSYGLSFCRIIFSFRQHTAYIQWKSAHKFMQIDGNKTHNVNMSPNSPSFSIYYGNIIISLAYVAIFVSEMTSFSFTSCQLNSISHKVLTLDKDVVRLYRKIYKNL